jgi:hypothetical protein
MVKLVFLYLQNEVGAWLYKHQITKRSIPKPILNSGTYQLTAANFGVALAAKRMPIAQKAKRPPALH